MSLLLRYLALLCALLLSFAISLVSLGARQSQAGSLQLAKPASLLPASNASAQADRSPSRDVLLLNTDAVTHGAKVVCDDHLFGNPPAASCQDAVNQMYVDPSVLDKDPTYTYGPRGLGVWDVNLPKRYISCEPFLDLSRGWTEDWWLSYFPLGNFAAKLINVGCIADGLCVVDFTQVSTPSHVKLFDVLSAAAVMQAKCVNLVTPTCTSLLHSVPYANCLET